MNKIEQNRTTILEKITKFHSLSLYKDANLPKLIAVSKKQNEERVLQALQCGHRIFGENRVQEAANKFSDIKKLNQGIELHLTGPLQTNKVKIALSLFDVFHTLDREKLAKEFTKYPEEIKNKTFFVQVNIGEETTKSGVKPTEVNDFLDYCINVLKLNISGLMCIPPFKEDPTSHFLLLKEIATQNNLKNLSMGMSDDYKIAILNGATHIRVGTALFGSRNT